MSQNTSPKRSALPLLLYDLRAASQLLPAAAVLPEQFHGPPTDLETVQGEVSLMRAILEDALHCFQRQFVTGGRRTHRLAKEAEEWFFTDDYTWPCSFINICAVLGLNPDYIRQGIKRWHEHGSVESPAKTRRTAVTRRPLKIAA